MGGQLGRAERSYEDFITLTNYGLTAAKSLAKDWDASFAISAKH
jgi:hypothetical protein